MFYVYRVEAALKNPEGEKACPLPFIIDISLLPVAHVACVVTFFCFSFACHLFVSGHGNKYRWRLRGASTSEILGLFDHHS
jgi:hypothetical protein